MSPYADDLAAAADIILRSAGVDSDRVVDDLNVKIFADGADLDVILGLAADKRIAGFTTNPTLMWKAGLTDYEEFAKRLLERITTHPISFEVFADDAAEMRRQATMIVRLGEQRLREDSRCRPPRANQWRHWSGNWLRAVSR